MMVKLGECQEYILSYPYLMDSFSGGFLLVLQGVATTPIPGGALHMGR